MNVNYKSKKETDKNFTVAIPLAQRVKIRFYKNIIITRKTNESQN